MYNTVGCSSRLSRHFFFLLYSLLAFVLLRTFDHCALPCIVHICALDRHLSPPHRPTRFEPIAPRHPPFAPTVWSTRDHSDNYRSAAFCVQYRQDDENMVYGMLASLPLSVPHDATPVAYRLHRRSSSNKMRPRLLLRARRRRSRPHSSAHKKVPITVIVLTLASDHTDPLGRSRRVVVGYNDEDTL